MATGATGAVSQQVRFCRSSDGVSIAYAVHGNGPPLVLNSCWLSHLEFDWSSPVWRHYLDALGSFATVIRFDERGFGMSDRSVTDFRLELRVADLAAVVDHAGLTRFALMAMAQGGPVAVRYAVENPGRVTRLVFADTHAAVALPPSSDQMLLEQAFQAMIAAGWDRKEPLFRRVFTQLMIPGATEEQMTWVDDLQQRAASARTVLNARQHRRTDNVLNLLPLIDAPTLVAHSRGDRMIAFDEGRRIAAGIAGARLLSLGSNNHILLAHEPAWRIFLEEITSFLADDLEAYASTHLTTDDAVWPLTVREDRVLLLAAEGKDNREIAGELVLSVRKVERHLQNVYAKLNLSGSAARTAAVARALKRS
ncbi:hypothetical protein GCM10027403_03450 [Arthrobacter tecti]